VLVAYRLGGPSLERRNYSLLERDRADKSQPQRSRRPGGALGRMPARAFLRFSNDMEFSGERSESAATTGWAGLAADQPLARLLPRSAESRRVGCRPVAAPRAANEADATALMDLSALVGNGPFSDRLQTERL
jgi:hypothetical protein